jgi:hypothetical protein
MVIDFYREQPSFSTGLFLSLKKRETNPSISDLDSCGRRNISPARRLRMSVAKSSNSIAFGRLPRSAARFGSWADGRSLDFAHRDERVFLAGARAVSVGHPLSRQVSCVRRSLIAAIERPAATLPACAMQSDPEDFGRTDCCLSDTASSSAQAPCGSARGVQHCNSLCGRHAGPTAPDSHVLVKTSRGDRGR